MPRKTFSIAKLIHTVNKRNERSTCSAEVRQGWNSLLSDVLMEADVYAGFNYLGPDDIPVGARPGIAFQDKHGNSLTPIKFFERLDAQTEANFLKGENVSPTNNGDERTFPDESRRFYYVHQSLLEAYSKFRDCGIGE